MDKKLILLENKDQALEYLKNKEKFRGFIPITFTFPVEKLLSENGIKFKMEEEYEKEGIYKGIHLETRSQVKNLCNNLSIKYKEINLGPLFYNKIYLILALFKKYDLLLKKIIQTESPEEIVTFKSESFSFFEKEFSSYLVKDLFKGKIKTYKYFPNYKKDKRDLVPLKLISFLQKIFIKFNLIFEKNKNKIFFSGGNHYFKPILEVLSKNKTNKLFNFDNKLRKSLFIGKNYIPFYEFSGKKDKSQNKLKKDLKNLKSKINRLNLSEEVGIKKELENSFKYWLENFMDFEILEIAKQMEEALTLFKKSKANLIPLSSDSSPFERSIVQISKFLKIPSIVFQHGINCNEISYPMLSDYLLIFGENTMKWLIKNNSKINNLKIIGSPRHDSFKKEIKENKERDNF